MKFTKNRTHPAYATTLMDLQAFVNLSNDIVSLLDTILAFITNLLGFLNPSR